MLQPSARASWFLLGVLGVLSALSSAPGAGTTDYTLSFEPGGKRWTVEARLDGRGEEQLDFRFALWTPGAYHVADYGRFVKALEARDEQGAELAVERPEPGHFVVRGAGAAREIVVRYEAEAISSSLFSHGIIDVESNRIARGYAFVNPPSLFGFVPARLREPVRLEVRLPNGWRAATVLASDAEGRFEAADFLRFEDSPLLFSPTLETSEFELDGKPHRVSVHGRPASEVAAIAAGCRRIAEAGRTLMGGLPYARYHFLYAFADEAGGSGLEHSDSTLILVNSGTRTSEDETTFWSLTAHEFFHLWCAERIHVQAIREPDLLAPLETGTIWVNEGLTEYFCRHLLLHAGFLEPEELLEGYLAGGGRPRRESSESWTDVSRAAASWEDMTDLLAFVERMYSHGPRTVFALDMTMRRATSGERGVLDLLRHLDVHYAQRGRGFGEDELDDVLRALAGAPAAEFYARFIDGPEIPDPTEFLDVIGYRFARGELEDLDPDAATLRARRDYFSITGEP
jgi:predicted metalloprotease with PDZ domain